MKPRRAVADVVAGLDAKAPATPSLCRGWTVHAVAGHLAADVPVHDGDIRVLGFVARGRLRGVRLIAEDLNRSAGEGQRAQGRGIDVLMAACGRQAVLPTLSATGVRVLDGRLPG